MSETPLNPTLTQKALLFLIGALQAFHNGKVAMYKDLAYRLSESVGHTPPWTWRYVQGVLAGTLSPSPTFARSVLALKIAVEKTPSTQTDLELVQVFARPGTVQPGAIVLAESRSCANPSCTVCFIPLYPEQIFCSICQPSL